MKKNITTLIIKKFLGHKGTVRIFVEEPKLIFTKRFREIYKGTFADLPNELRTRAIIGKPYFNAENELIIDVRK